MKFTVVGIQKFAKACGFTFKRHGTGYLLVTLYGEYMERRLEDVNRIIIRDNKRMNSSRF